MSSRAEEGPTTERPHEPVLDDATSTRWASPTRPPEPGDELAGFQIEGLAGRGGMGLVYRARQRRPDRTVAVKVISPELASSPTFRTRFEQESAIAARIEHPNVIPVYAVGEAEGLLYIAMRFVEGVDLGELLAASGRLEPARAARLIAQIADALDAAHAHGLVHRDVKPGNVLVTPSDHAYLTDFGLTKRATETSGLTRSGAFVGTVHYIAPEQIRGERIDARTDVYALGCVTYQLLSGRVPFEGDAPLAILLAHVNEPAPELKDVPAPLADAVQRAMGKDPDERFLSAGDFARAVSAGVQGQASPSTERTVATGPAAILAGPRGPSATEPADRRMAVGGRRRRAWILALVAAVVLAVAGAGAAVALSGGSPPPSAGAGDGQIAATADAYLGAIAGGEGAAACARLTAAARAQAAARAPSGSKTCAAAVDRASRSETSATRQALRDASLTNLDVTGGTATVGVQGAMGTLELSDLGARWLISGNTLRFAPPSTPQAQPPPAATTTASAGGCVLTIDDPFAQIQATPGYPPQSGEKIPAGSYTTITSEVLSFAGQQTRWYEISVDGRTGWIADDNVQIASKSAGCPLS